MRVLLGMKKQTKKRWLAGKSLGKISVIFEEAPPHEVTFQTPARNLPQTPPTITLTHLCT